MNREESSILANLGRYYSLGDDDRELLLDLEQKSYAASDKETLWRAGARVDKLYTIKSGWACTFRHNFDGLRQVVDILLPGDIIGLRDFTFKRHLSEARMITRGTVCAFPYHKIIDIIETSTPLTIALFSSIARQEAILTERMLNTIHRSARSRIAHFVLETYTRLNKVRATELENFFLPISQQMLGEILGISYVHINRSLMAMERDNLLKKHRRHIEVIDQAKLFEEADFDDEYLSDDLNGLREYLKLSVS